MTKSAALYEKPLKEIAKLAKKYGDQMQPPCTPAQLDKLRDEAKKRLQVAIPDAYARFLELHNGLDWNGLSIYASEKVPIAGHTDRSIKGWVEANLVRRDYPKWSRFLIFGETGEEEYCLDLAESKYVVVDSVSMDILETYPSWDALIAEALDQRR